MFLQSIQSDIDGLLEVPEDTLINEVLVDSNFRVEHNHKDDSAWCEVEEREDDEEPPELLGMVHAVKVSDCTSGGEDTVVDNDISEQESYEESSGSVLSVFTKWLVALNCKNSQVHEVLDVLQIGHVNRGNDSAVNWVFSIRKGNINNIHNIR